MASKRERSDYQEQEANRAEPKKKKRRHSYKLVKQDKNILGLTPEEHDVATLFIEERWPDCKRKLRIAYLQRLAHSDLLQETALAKENKPWCKKSWERNKKQIEKCIRAAMSQKGIEENSPDEAARLAYKLLAWVPGLCQSFYSSCHIGARASFV